MKHNQTLFKPYLHCFTAWWGSKSKILKRDGTHCEEENQRQGEKNQKLLNCLHPWKISASRLDLAVKSDIVKSGKVNIVKTYKDLGLRYHGC